MSRQRFLLTLALLALLTACSGGNSGASVGSGGPAFRQLSEQQLEDLLLTVDDMPAGYSQNPPDNGGATATYCGSAPEHAPIRPDHGFTKGSGFSTEVASIQLSQYLSADDAARNLGVLRSALGSCKSEVYQGERVHYSQVSTPRLKYPTLGIRVASDRYTALIEVAQVGPTIVVAGIAGITNADAKLASAMLTTQVSRYEDAALENGTGSDT